MPVKTSPRAKKSTKEGTDPQTQNGLSQPAENGLSQPADSGLDREVATRLLKKRRVVTQHVSFVLDESGSMQSVKQATLDGFNEYLASLQLEGNASFTLAAFNTKARIIHESMAVSAVEPLTDKSYQPGGGTALLDAVGMTIERIDRELSGKNDPVLVVVLTDGEENASGRFTQAQVQEMITQREAKGNWTFAYIGASASAWQASAAMGFAQGNTARYSADATGTSDAFRRLASASRGRMVGASMGVSSSVNFYADAGVNVSDDLGASPQGGVNSPTSGTAATNTTSPITNATPKVVNRVEDRGPKISGTTTKRWVK